MDRIICLFLLLGLTPSHAVDMSAVERINKRYDDFFRYIHERDERIERANKGNDERHKREIARLEKLEQARQKYVQERKTRVSTEALRLKHEREVKEQQEQMELLRRRYVQQRDEIEQYLKKGRTIPPMKEYDLEGY